jgi:hypothetical protein
MSTLPGEELIECLCDPEVDPDDATSMANELLGEFHRGFPVERLRQLLGSAHGTAVRSGAWIASELAADASPLVCEIDRLLEHDDRCVRFFAVGAVLGGAARRNAATLAKAIGRVQDQDKAVRWKTLHLLSKTGVEQLRASLQSLTGELRAEAEWLCGEVAPAEICARLNHPRGTARLFAVAAAERMAALDASPLQHAASCDDSEVRSFAREQISLRELLGTTPLS